MISDACIFCTIARKEIPAHVVYEDDDFLAFMDVNPRAAGHVQVISKQHTRWVWDVPAIGRYFEIVRDIAKAEQKAFGIELIRSQVFGDEVAHAHVWVWPNESVGDPKDLVGNAMKIRGALARQSA